MKTLNESIMSLRGFAFDGEHWEKGGVRMLRVPDYAGKKSKALKLVDMLRDQFGDITFDTFQNDDKSWSCKIQYEKMARNGRNDVINSEVYDQPTYAVAVCKAWIAFMRYAKSNNI